MQKSQVNFFCQKCRQPLLVDPELASIDTTILGGESSIQFDGKILRPSTGLPVSRKVIHSTKDSFVMLSNEPKANQSLLAVGKLFNVLSGKSDIDHPLCQECADGVMEFMDRQIKTAHEEKQLYEQALKQTREYPNEEELQSEIEKLLEEEKQLQETLESLKKEHKEIQDERKSLKEQEKEIDLLEKKYWQEYNDFDEHWQAVQLEKESLENQFKHASAQLERLRKTNVYNDTFHIWHDGAFGTINGFRLGRLPDTNVEWNEINAAWGQAALLLYLLVEKLGLTLSYRIIPMGSFSKIEKLGEDKAVYELYGSGDLQLSRLFWNRRFDQGMVAFLDCLNQVGEFAESKDASFKLPYKIKQDKIGDVSIRAQFSQNEQWTKALKYMLTNLKWILAFSCKVEINA